MLVLSHPIALWFLEAFARVGGRGLAAPSANRFGNVSPTTAQAVADELSEYLGGADVILDGGACAVGVESTIIDHTGDLPRILRPGAVTVAMIEESAGLQVVDSVDAEEIRVGGSLDSHYAPVAKILLCQTPTAGQGIIAHAAIETPEGVIRLASPHSDEEFAQILYSALRAADAARLAEVVVMQPIGMGIGVAIRDRLQRASFE